MFAAPPPDDTMGLVSFEHPQCDSPKRLSENIEIFDFEPSGDEMRRIFRMAGAKGRHTDFSFAPK